MTKYLGRPRLTAHIQRRVTQAIFRAIDFAEATGRPLNNYIVINLHETTTISAAELFTRIRHKFRDWLAYKRKAGVAHLPPLYAYSLENPTGTPHANWLVHVPVDLQQEFERKLPAWVKRAQGAARPFDISRQTVKRNTVKRLAKYIVKGTDPAYVDHFFLADLHAPQGEVWGKRAGTSMSLGAAMRRESGFKVGRRMVARMKGHNDNAKVA